MGVWSSISFCNFDKRKISHTCNPCSRTSNMKQILNVDSDRFSTTVLQDVKEIRIQESVQFPWNDRKEESLDYPTYFEYSMGGNVKFYKEHLQQDFDLENKLYSIKNPGQIRLRKSSHSDNDSEPESLRYARKPQEKVIPVVNTIAEEAELSYDDYSTIYQPEFMLNINSESLVKEMPNHVLEERNVNEEETTDQTKKNKISSWFQDLIQVSPQEKFHEIEIVRVVTKTEILPPVERNTECAHQKDVFDYHSSAAREKKNSKQLENQEIRLVKQKSKEGIKDKMSIKPRKPKSIIKSSESNVPEAKNTLTKEIPLSKKQKKNILDKTASPLKIIESKNESKDRAKNLVNKEKLKKLIQTKEYDNEENISTFNNKVKDIVSVGENNPKNYKTQDDFPPRLSLDTNAIIFDNIDMFEELGIAPETEEKISEPTKKEIEFYPESPISELHFFKTPCSTRHNSLETFEQLENECISEDIGIKQEAEKLQDNIMTSNLLLVESYKKLPKEFQEMARRLSRKDSPKKSSLSLLNPSLNFNCSSSTCSTVSPRSPSGRKLFRTPSYKMPKTPSLSRQHPSTYVTQHTSSRSKPSSRVSSRATSPTREHIEALL